MKTWRDLDGANIAQVVGELTDYDGLVERLRERAADIGLAYRTIDDLANMAEGATGKYLADLRVKRLTIESLLSIVRVLGIKVVFVADPELTARMAPSWVKRDAARAHARRLASLSEATVKRLLPAVASEYGKRAGRARMAKMTPAALRKFQRNAARARWHRDK